MIFSCSEIGPFHRMQHNIFLFHLKRSSSTRDIFEVDFDTATLIIPRFVVVKARRCKPRYKSDLSRSYLVPDKIYMLYF